MRVSLDLGLDAAALNSPIRKAIYEAVGRRFEEHLASEKVILDWESVSSAVKEAQIGSNRIGMQMFLIEHWYANVSY